MDDQVGKDSWKTLPLPDQQTSLSANWTFTAEEFNMLRRGLLPEAMEDKWFIYYEGDWLNFHRSWTGICIYKMKITPQETHYLTEEILVNRDPEEYSSTDEGYDLFLLRQLIDSQLLRRG